MNDTQEPSPKFRDDSLPVEQRVADLVGRLTLEEKIAQMRPYPPGIARLGIPPYRWENECLHGLCQTGRATCFPQAIGLAATFDPDLMERLADATSTEARAKHHDPAWHGPEGHRVGLTFWSPNINIFRDPRWGRGQETYGEDPHLTGVMGAAFVRGIQGDHPRYLKAGACAKHLAAHSGPERLRQSFDAVVSRKDLFETYLPAFRALVDAGVVSVMATYNRLNGEPCCGSATLLSDILREAWGFEGFVVSDAGAVEGSHQHHGVTRDARESAVLALSAGCDMENRSRCYDELPAAIEEGLVSEEDIDRSLSRLLKVRFRLGLFDDPKQVPYTDVRADAVQCDAHLDLAHEAAVKSVVLLKNDGVLPLGPDVRRICVTGPNAADLDVLLGNFYRAVSGRLCTVLEGITRAAPEGTIVTYMKGCHLEHPSAHRSDWVLGQADESDVVVAVMGISPLMEGESGECIASPDGGDREEIGLPPNQMDLLRRLKSQGKPLVLVVTGGSPIAMPEAHDMADAVLFIWYPGERGGTAVGDVLFGARCPSGKLPVTFPRSLDQLPPYTDYSMRGHTYRYMTQEPLYPFGFGLSYTRFEYGQLAITTDSVHAGESVSARVMVTNVGQREGEEVVQLYLTDREASVEVPRCALKAFRRVRLAAGESATVEFRITPEMMELVNEDGDSVLEPGAFTVTVGGCSPGVRGEELGAPAPASADFEVV